MNGTSSSQENQTLKDLIYTLIISRVTETLSQINRLPYYIHFSCKILFYPRDKISCNLSLSNLNVPF